MPKKDDELTLRNLIEIAKTVSENRPDGASVDVTITLPDEDAVRAIDAELFRVTGGKSSDFKGGDSVYVTLFDVRFTITITW